MIAYAMFSNLYEYTNENEISLIKENIIYDKWNKIMKFLDNRLLIPLDYEKRPNCDEILEQIKDWSLNESEIRELKIFDDFEDKLSKKIIFSYIS